METSAATTVKISTVATTTHLHCQMTSSGVDSRSSHADRIPRPEYRPRAGYGSTMRAMARVPLVFEPPDGGVAESIRLVGKDAP